jgi:hypothetical protein
MQTPTSEAQVGVTDANALTVLTSGTLDTEA